MFRAIDFRSVFNKDLALNLYLPLIPASVVIHETLTFILMGMLFLSNASYFTKEDDSNFRYWCKVSLIAILVIEAIIILNGIIVVGTDPALIFGKGHRLFIILCLAPTITDFIYCTAKDVKLDAVRIFKNFHIALLVFTLAKLAYAYYLAGAANVPISSLRDLIGRYAGFFSGNPNHFDDYAVILFITSIWVSLFALMRSNSESKWQYYLAPVLASAFYFNIIVYSENRGGWIGFALAAAFVFFVLLYMRKVRLIAFITLLIAVGFGFYYQSIKSEMTRNWATVENALGLGEATNQTDVKGEAIPADRCRDGKATISDFAMIPNRNTYTRLKIIPFAIDAWRARPLLGYGAYDRDHLTERFESEDRCVELLMGHPHNIFLHQAIVGGLLYVTLVIGMILMPVIFLYRTFRNGRREALLFLPPATYSVYLLTENQFNHSLANMDYAAITTLVLLTATSLVLSHHQKHLSIDRE